ncbi:hypothetical protein FACS1894200_09370 [Spirochaetia bacterium]|nr:hypothetical protein FACS1894200_09370 [Spirochaetia bacterium]
MSGADKQQRSLTRHNGLESSATISYIRNMGNHYKDSLFRSLFNDKKVLLELYNGIKGTHYDENTELVINTLSETLFTHQKNDVSFLIERKLVVLGEQQSTIYWNMPYRFLFPVARLLENSIKVKDAVYRQKLVKLPRPEFIVLYNGMVDFPDKKTLRLSDAFEDVKGVGINLELLVTVYNINRGHNEKMVKKSKTLYGYAMFVDRVRTNLEQVHKECPQMIQGEALKEAIVRTIAYCKAHDILAEFLEQLTNEEVYMLAAEWNQDRALAIRWEEGRETGWEEGREEKEEEVIRNAVKAGLSFDIIQQITGADRDTIAQLINC